MKSFVHKKRYQVLIGVFVLLLLGIAANQFCLYRENKSSDGAYGQMVHVDGKQFCVSVEGEGKKKIVLLSGWGTASPVLDFKPLTNQLKSEYTVAVVEGLGYGLSGDTLEARSVENITKEIHEVISQLGFDSYALMVHSISGIYALYYANQYEEEVEAVIGLDSSAPKQLDKETVSMTLMQDVQNCLIPFLNQTGILRAASKISPDILVPVWEGDSLSSEEAKTYRIISLHRLMNHTVMDELHQMKASCERLDGMEYPKTMPVLFFLASDSVNTMDWWSEIHEQQIKDLDRKKILVLEGSHYLHHTQAKAIAEETEKFYAPD